MAHGLTRPCPSANLWHSREWPFPTDFEATLDFHAARATSKISYAP